MNQKEFFSPAIDVVVVRLQERVEVYALGAQLTKLPEGNHMYALDNQAANLLIVIWV